MDASAASPDGLGAHASCPPPRSFSAGSSFILASHLNPLLVHWISLSKTSRIPERYSPFRVALTSSEFNYDSAHRGLQDHCLASNSAPQLEVAVFWENVGWRSWQSVDLQAGNWQFTLPLLTVVPSGSLFLRPSSLRVQETLRTVAGRVPQGAYHRIGHILMDLVGRMLLGMLLSDDVPAFNLYGLFRLHGDALALAEFAAKTDIPGLQVRLR